MAKELDQNGIFLQKLQDLKPPFLSDEKKGKLKNHLFAKIKGDLPVDHPYSFSELASNLSEASSDLVLPSANKALIKESLFDGLDAKSQTFFGRLLKPVSYFAVGIASVFALFVFWGANNESGWDLEDIGSFWAGVFDNQSFDDFSSLRENIYFAANDSDLLVLRNNESFLDFEFEAPFFFEPGDRLLTFGDEITLNYFDLGSVIIGNDSTMFLDSNAKDDWGTNVKFRLERGSSNFSFSSPGEKSYVVMANDYYFTSDNEARFDLTLRDQRLEIDVKSEYIYLFKKGDPDYLRVKKGKLVLEAPDSQVVDSSDATEKLDDFDFQFDRQNGENDVLNNGSGEQTTNQGGSTDSRYDFEGGEGVSIPVNGTNDSQIPEYQYDDRDDDSYSRLLDMIVGEESESNFEVVEDDSYSNTDVFSEGVNGDSSSNTSTQSGSTNTTQSGTTQSSTQSGTSGTTQSGSTASSGGSTQGSTQNLEGDQAYYPPGSADDPNAEADQVFYPDGAADDPQVADGGSNSDAGFVEGGGVDFNPKGEEEETKLPEIDSSKLGDTVNIPGGSGVGDVAPIDFGTTTGSSSDSEYYEFDVKAPVVPIY